MKTYARKTTSITTCILDYLKEKNGDYVTTEEICEILNERVAISPNVDRTKLILSTLVTAGVIEVSSARRRHKYFKIAPTTTTTTCDDSNLDWFNNKISVLENKLAKAQNDISSSVTEKVIGVELLKDGQVVSSFKDLFHSCFEQVLQLAEARMNVFIYGPTGCGKSHICEQVAKSLDLPFYFVSCTAGMSEGVLGGRLLPTGDNGQFEYTISEFIKAYENGGVFLLDEIDAADPNVLLLINAALANGKVSVPNRPEAPYAVRHKDFICVAAANTVGTGADRLYSGRNKLDAATLDRFQIGKVHMDYSSEVEEQLCPDVELRNTLLRYRKAINANRLERAMSTRFMRDAYKMKSEFKWTQSQIDKAFFSGWREDEINKVIKHV